MATYKTQAVVLKSHKLGEIDRVLTLYTKERGRVSAVAKGTRKVKSKLGGRLEPFSVVDALIYDGKSLDIVQQAETLMVLDKLRSDFKRMEMAGSVVRLILKTCHEAEPNQKLFNLAVRVLMEIENGPSLALLVAFQLKYLFLSGYRPHLSLCVSCGADRGDFAFGPEKGGLICGRCADFEMELINLSLDGKEAMTDMMSSSLSSSKEKHGESSELVFEVSRCAEAMLKYHMGYQG